MPDEIKDLLAVLDMTEEEQWTYLAKAGLMSHPWDAQSIKLGVLQWKWEAFFHREAKKTFQAKLADLAFALRDEVIGFSTWPEAKRIVHKQREGFMGGRYSVLTAANRYFADIATATDIVITALIAKKLAKEK